MKKYFFYVLLLLLFFVSFHNIKQTSEKETKLTYEVQTNAPAEVQFIEGETYEEESDTTDGRAGEMRDSFAATVVYPPHALNLPDSMQHNSDRIDIQVRFPSVIHNANLYLYINDQKRDLFFSVNPSNYIFKNVRIEKGINNIEVFYLTGNKKSVSAHSLIYGD